MRKSTKQQSKCFECKYAGTACGTVWEKPVPFSRREATKLKTQRTRGRSELIDSFHVYSCPRFVHIREGRQCRN